MVRIMQLRSKLVLVAVAILTGCSTPKPASIDKSFKVCDENENPSIDNCRHLGPTTPITIRGVRE